MYPPRSPVLTPKVNQSSTSRLTSNINTTMKVQSQIYIHSHSNDNGAITICTATLNTDSSLPHLPRYSVRRHLRWLQCEKDI
mmetsp:Transcript_20632/g.50659  ORF Transcript_20632/g.50659 Transcript_20632/m.50659 type:complete len:82 (-) Transcript_20632:2693-2938(-)